MAKRFSNQGFSSNTGMPNQVVHGPVPHRGMQRPMLARGGHGPVSNRGNHDLGFNRGNRDPLPHQGLQGTTSNRGFQGSVDESGMQGHMSARGFQGLMSGRGMQGSLSNRGNQGRVNESGMHDSMFNIGFQGPTSQSDMQGSLSNQQMQGSMSYQGMQSPPLNTDFQMPKGNSGVQVPMSNRGMEGSVNERSMCDSMSKRDFEDPMPKTGMQGPYSNQNSNQNYQGFISKRSLQGPLSNQGIQRHMSDDRGMPGLMSNSGMQTSISDRGMQSSISDRGVQGPSSDRGMQGPMYNRGMQGPLSDRGMQGPLSDRDMQGSMSDRGMHGPMSDRGMHCPVSDRVMQGPMSDKGMHGSMSDRVMQGPLSDRGMHGPMSDRGMQGPLSDRGMQGPMSDRGMQGSLSDRGMHGPMSDRGIQGPMPDRGMQGPISDRVMQGPMSDRGMQGPMSDRGMHGPMPDRGMQGPMSDRGMHGPMPDRGMKGPMSDRGMQGPLSDRGMQGPMSDRGMQGSLSDRGMQGPMFGRGEQGPMSCRDIQGPSSYRGVQGTLSDKRMPVGIYDSGRNASVSKRDFQSSLCDRGSMQGSIPDRGMQGQITDSMEGPMSKRSFQSSVSNSGFQGPTSNRVMQGALSNRDIKGSVSDRGLHESVSGKCMPSPMFDSGMQVPMPVRGMQQHMSGRRSLGPESDKDMHASLSYRGMKGQMSDKGFQGPMSNSGVQGYMSESVMQGSVSDKDVYGPAADCGIQGHEANRSMRGLVSNKGFPGPHNSNSIIYEQNIHSGPLASEFEGKGQFPVHQSVHSVGGFQGNPQVIALNTQPGSVSQTSVSQGSVVQHVVIPVPVPVGTEIPSHLLRPHIITSAGQSNLVGPEGQSQIPGTQSKVEFSGMQGHGVFPGNSQSQTNRNDLNYYIGTKSQREDVGRSGENTSYGYDNEWEKWPYNTEEAYSKVRNQENERRHHMQQKTEERQEYEIKQRERSRSHDSSNFSYASEHNDRSRREHSHVGPYSDSLREKHTVYKRQEEFERVELQSSQENFGIFDSSRGRESYSRNEEFRKSETSDTKFHHDRNSAAEKEYDIVNRYDKFERNQSSSIGSEELNRYSQFEKDQRHIHREEVRVNQDKGEYRELVKHQIESSDKAHTSYRPYDEHPSSDLRYEIKGRHDKQSESDSGDIRKVNNHSGESNVRNDKTHGGERQTRAVLITDGKREDIDSIRYEKEDRHDIREHQMIEEENVYNKGRGKRKLSPASSDRSSKKDKRNYSPISDGKSHGDLKIHVSDKGRWIETDSNLSPVSNSAFESDRNVEQGHRINELDKGDDINSLDGAEMISDSESLIGNDDKDVRTGTNDLSPISQHSLGKESSEEKEESAEYKHEVERESLCQSQHSSHSEEKLKHDGPHDGGSSHSHQTRERKHSSQSELSEQKSQLTDKSVKEFQLRVSDLCTAHNQKGCGWYGCAKLHVCKFFVLGFCKFGEYCTKGHTFFRGQPCDILSKINPGFRKSNVTAEQIKLLLKNRISCINVAADLQRRLSTYKTENYGKVTVNEEQNVVDVDPSFDARNYAPGSSFDFKSGVKGEKKKSSKKKNDDTKEKKDIGDKTKKVDAKDKNSLTSSEKSSQITKHKQSKQKSIGIEADKSKNKHKSSDKKKGKNDKENAKDKTNKLKTEDASMLSPISGDEDDWEKYEKYENVSEDEMSEKNDDLDNVSSDESVVEQVQVNRSVDSFPLPTPENIAVPIGMNDPLVFNRPLKNNPQSYIGPLNRPPPAFPLTTDSNMPLFPVVTQTLQPPNISIGVPGLAIGVPGTIPGSAPNHLPSPEFLKHVVENLPKFKIESSEQKNVFKNDNNPSVIEALSHKKKTKTDKVERDPQLKETIKKLWKFPHKGVFNMSIIEFVTETEAYKEEFIAEIVRILVTLELPYVTMKKLLAVIKERVSINVKSETDMRKILEMYPNNFKIIETLDSDDESDDSGSKKNVKIKANIGLGFCEKHGFLPFAIGKCECNSLHLCKFYFLSDCPSKLCKFGHKLKTDHNIAVLKQLKLHRLTGEEIINFLADIENRNKETIPSICKYYIREKGCYKGDNTDYETICHSLHLCSYILKGKCMNRECDRSHSIRDKQPFSLLQKYGLDPNELGDERVLQMLGEKALESEKDKSRKVATKQQSGLSKARLETTSGSSMADSQGKTSSPGEGLTLLTHTETRISSKYFIQNFKVPAVCKFYQNEMGCRKKDWGSEGKCLFLHICQHYVNGDCKFGHKCKRSHDMFSGQAAEILEKYNFDLRNMTADDIIKRLNNISGDPVEIPEAESTGFDKGKVEITGEYEGKSNEMDSSKLEKSKNAMEAETSVNIDDKDEFTFNTDKKSKDTSSKGKQRSVKQPASSYHSGDIEDVIKHIMEHNKVVEK